MKNIKEKYGADVIIIMGDWSSKGINNKLKNNKPTPNLGLTRMLSKRFELYLIDEYKTSQLHYETEEKTGNLWVKEIKISKKKKKKRKKKKKKKDKLKPLLEGVKIHSVLSYQTKSKRKGFINRDNNATRNMVKIVKHIFEFKERPKIFTR